MDVGHINLKCSDFIANVFSSFKILHNSDIFTDVTLVSDDNKQIQAHKLILSAGSEYFRGILSDKSHPHPMLCLDGISSDDLTWIIKYLYVGEVSVPQLRLQKFLTIAKKLKCFGLNEEGPGMDKVEHYDNEISHNIENVNMPEPTTVEDTPLLDIKDIVDLCDDRDQETVYVKTEAEITNEPLTNSDNGEHYDNEISHIVDNAKVPEPTPIKDTPLSDENHIVNLCNDKDQELVVAKAEEQITNEMTEEGKIMIKKIKVKCYGLNEKVNMQEPTPIKDISLLHEKENQNVGEQLADVEAEPKITNETDLKIERKIIIKKRKTFPVCRINGKPVSKDQLYDFLEIQYHLEQGIFYQCNHCELRTLKAGHIREHVQKHIKNLELDCDMCGKIFRGTQFLRDHKGKNCQTKKTVTTEQANAIAPVETFINGKINGKPFPNCRINGKPVSRDHLDNLLKENYQRQGVTYQCNKCEYTSVPLETMKEHTQRHIQNLEFDCNVCGKIVHTTNYLRQHKVNQHNPDNINQTFPCNYCDYKTTKKYRLRSHTITQHLNEKAQCPYCGKQISPKGIKVHIQRCTSQKQ